MSGNKNIDFFYIFFINEINVFLIRIFCDNIKSLQITQEIKLNIVRLILTFFLISSCATTVVDQRQVIPELFDPELKKGKIFVFSNHMDPLPMNIRVNGEVRKIKHTETQIFDLKDGQNSVKNLGRVSTGESSNCDKQPYTFNTEMFPEVETYYFVIQQGFDSTIRTFTCFKDFEVTENAFLKQINNPRNGGSEFLQDLSKSFINSLIF